VALDSASGGLTASSCHPYAISMLIFSRRRGRLETAVMLGLEMRFPVPVRLGDEASFSGGLRCPLDSTKWN